MQLVPISPPPERLNLGAMGDSWSECTAKIALWFVWVEENRLREGFGTVWDQLKADLYAFADLARMHARSSRGW